MGSLDFPSKALTPKEQSQLPSGGAATADMPPRRFREIGTVVEYDTGTDSYKVETRGSTGPANKQTSKRVLPNVPRKSVAPGEGRALPVGTTVVLDYSFSRNLPFIDGVLPFDYTTALREAALNQGNLEGAGEGTQAEGKNEYPINFRAPGIPEMTEGDSYISTPSGNRMRVDRGNYTALDAGEKDNCAVELFGDHDVLRARCENFELYTGWGTVLIQNIDNKNNLSIRAGIDKETETGGGQKNWTFKLDVGNDGDYFNMQVCDPAGYTKASYHITPDGKVTHLATNGFDVVNASATAPLKIESAADKIEDILGEVRSYIENAYKKRVGGARETRIGESDLRIVGGNSNTNIGGESSVSISGRHTHAVTGTLDATPLNVAFQQSVANGSYQIDVGKTSEGAIGTAKGGFYVRTYNGDIVLGEGHRMTDGPSTTSRVSLNTSQPNSVGLGCSLVPGSPNVARDWAVLYTRLDALLRSLMAHFDAHVHPTGIGPSGPPPAPMTAALGSNIPPLKSLRVRLNG